MQEGPTSMSLRYKTATGGPLQSSRDGLSQHTHDHGNQLEGHGSISALPSLPTAPSCLTRVIESGLSRKRVLKTEFLENTTPENLGGHIANEPPKGSPAPPPKQSPVKDMPAQNETPSDPAAPHKDKFSIQPLPQSTLKDALDVTVSCELMHNCSHGMPGMYCPYDIKN